MPAMTIDELEIEMREMISRRMARMFQNTFAFRRDCVIHKTNDNYSRRVLEKQSWIAFKCE
jgi:hypothetical protein